MQSDHEDMQRSVQQLKKKCKKLTAELQDTKLHLEGLHSRNHDLEKKQRKSVHPLSLHSLTRHLSGSTSLSFPTQRNTNIFFNLNAEGNVL